jgi:hypothetical protein
VIATIHSRGDCGFVTVLSRAFLIQSGISVGREPAIERKARWNRLWVTSG